MHDPDFYYTDEDEWAERVERFADPGGESALYPANANNPRNLPCGNCGHPDRLTPLDVAAGYQCDACAEALERGYDIDYYVEPDIVAEGIENSWLEEGNND